MLLKIFKPNEINCVLSWRSSGRKPVTYVPEEEVLGDEPAQWLKYWLKIVNHATALNSAEGGGSFLNTMYFVGWWAMRAASKGKDATHPERALKDVLTVMQDASAQALDSIDTSAAKKKASSGKVQKKQANAGKRKAEATKEDAGKTVPAKKRKK
jgi:hypothetical protein